MYTAKGPTVLLLSLAASLLAVRVTSQGLFPSLHSPLNFALSEPVTATSTCAQCEEGAELEAEDECATCNNTCPYGDSLPPPLDLMVTGILQEGVVSLCFMVSLSISAIVKNI